MNPYERACKIWLQSCSCADQQAPWLCQECTATFGMHLLGLVVKDSLMAKPGGEHLRDGWTLHKHADHLHSFYNADTDMDLMVDLDKESVITLDHIGKCAQLSFDELEMLASFVRDQRRPV